MCIALGFPPIWWSDEQTAYFVFRCQRALLLAKQNSYFNTSSHLCNCRAMRHFVYFENISSANFSDGLISFRITINRSICWFSNNCLNKVLFTSFRHGIPCARPAISALLVFLESLWDIMFANWLTGGVRIKELTVGLKWMQITKWRL